MKPLMALTVMLLASIASAGPVEDPAKKLAGENVKIRISHQPSEIWGQKFTLKDGFTMGEGLIKVIPVTSSAYEVLRVLDKKIVYDCVIQKSTVEEKYSNGQFLGATYYVIDIDCR